MARATPKSFIIIIRFPLAVLLCSAAPVALSVHFSCPNVNHSVDATPSTVYQIEGQNILLVPAGAVSKFVAWQSRAQNSNTTTDISRGTGTKFQYEVFSLRILSMTSDLNGTQFRYITSESLFGKVIFLSNWTTTIIGHPPTITGIPSQTTFIEGDVETTITFNNSGTPNPVITCLNESSTQVVNYDRFKCTSGRLVFGPLFESDEGQYTVESVNCFGSNTTQMNIIVNRRPTIRGDFTNRSVECGGDDSVSYSIDGDPPPDFQWYFKGSPYNSAIQPTSSQLMIRNITSKDTGVYTLKVNNSAGEKSVSFTLLLNELKMLRFTQKPSLSESGQLGCMQPFNMTCIAKGSNLQSINWNKHIDSSGPVYQNKTIEYCREQEIHSTLLFSSGLSKSGQYDFSCQAKSTSLQAVKSSTSVQVLCPPTVKLTCDHCTSCTVGIQCPVGLTAEIHLAKEGEQPRFRDVSDLCTGQMVNHPFNDLTNLTLYTVTSTVKNDSLNQNQVSNIATAKATTPKCLSSESFPTAIVASVTVVAVIVLIAIVIGILKYRSVKQKAIGSMDPPAPYATSRVPESRSGHHQNETLTSSPLYEAATVQANPAYGVVKNDPTGRR